MMWTWLIGACCLLQAASAYNWRLYEDHKIFSATAHTESQVGYLIDLLHKTDLRFLEDPGRIGKKAKFFVHNNDVNTYLQDLTSQGIDVNVQENHLTENMRKEWERLSAPRTQAYDYADFNTYDDTMAELSALFDRCPATSVCESSSIGNSVEGRQIGYLSITRPENTKNIWIDATNHAREWLAPATTMNIINRIITNDPADPDLAKLNSVNWYYVPIVNPDGYEYTWTDDRYWRKNRANNDGACWGVDLNRNYDARWSRPGASDEPCSDTYHGPSAASEPETQAVQNQVTALINGGITLDAFWSVHSYGFYMLSPFGNCTSSTFPTPVQIADVCNAIENTHGTNWDCGNSCQVLYATSGTSPDFVSERFGVRFPYTPELRGVDFQIDPSQIQPSYEEIWAGLMAQIDQI